jgi:hypothetical protein
MKLYTVARVPDELADDWLKHLWAFGASHDDCDIEVICDAPLSADEIRALRRVDPDLSLDRLITPTRFVE